LPFSLGQRIGLVGPGFGGELRIDDAQPGANAAYRVGEFAENLGYPLDLRQVNCSVSRQGVIRGIHFTDVPPGQAKYVFCPSGALLDVIVAGLTDSENVSTTCALRPTFAVPFAGEMVTVGGVVSTVFAVVKVPPLL